MNFSLMKEHNYSLVELDNMIPYEREIYTGLLMKQINEDIEDANR